GRRDGRGPVGRPDRLRQPAGAHDPRPARAGARPGPGRARADDCLRPGPEELRLMARINLLPWREERRKQRQKEFFLMLAGSALGAIVLAFVIVSWHGAQVDGQQERNGYLKAQIATLDRQITEIQALDEQKSRLLARKDVIEQLQANRSQMVHLFDSLVRTIPDGVVLA